MTDWKRFTIVTAAIAAVGLLGACGSDDSADTTSDSTTPTELATATSHPAAPTVTPGSPAAALAATPWETTSARDSHGSEVPLTDDNVENYVGFAYFDPDGTFTMFGLDDAPKMHGDWSVSPDGKTRTIIAKDDAGREQSRRVVDIVTLNDQEFTYRIYLDPADKARYYDIVHTPTTHPEPAK
ncbi:DUF4822 domain-containing protein [Nocardia goodfellowii]|uniref:DUF4822 domain-containing protein n=1 Tax=Nocardia goodfellowii TaxID=882446 RepID=A0ABS4QDG0_9NOCA|nr:DUF4822 domain-containing protein [Nocardia goodfellowii]MBP2189702.1 hypothetical protein [Nocardia goodfellowii]